MMCPTKNLHRIGNIVGLGSGLCVLKEFGDIKRGIYEKISSKRGGNYHSIYMVEKLRIASPTRQWGTWMH